MDRRNFLRTISFASGSMFAVPWLKVQAGSTGAAWQQDGSGWRARIGVITPDYDPVPESEFWTLAPEGVSVHAARAVIGDPRTFANSPGVDDAAELLARLSLKAIVFAFTTSSYVQGSTGEDSFRARLEKRSRGTPVLLPCQAAVEAFRLFGVHRIVLVHPPWFPDEVDQAGAAYFRAHGFEVDSATHVHPTREFTEVHPGELYEWVRSHIPKTAEAVFIGGNGMRAIGVISALEQDLARPVLTANQVAFWYALHQAHVGAQISGYGEIFKHLIVGRE